MVTDAASWTEGLATILEQIQITYGQSIDVVDAIAFARSTVLPRLPAPARLPSIMVHPTCSTTRLGLTSDLLAIAAMIADEVEVPDDWGCCGFAGDRGLLHPELTASATAAQAAQVRRATAPAHVSANRTCEIAMTRATGQPYVHILEQVALSLGLFATPTSDARSSPAPIPHLKETQQ